MSSESALVPARADWTGLRELRPGEPLGLRPGLGMASSRVSKEIRVTMCCPL